jgi:hypothetical protein
MCDVFSFHSILLIGELMVNFGSEEYIGITNDGSICSASWGLE